MGFRDFEVFNLAMLAKQGWRIVKEPHTLLSRILKAKYFPFKYFPEAKLGTRPSFIWRSILARRDLLLKGLRWRVGNGRSINIWSEPWLPIPYSFKVSQHAKFTCPHATVASLIDFETGQWKIQDLNALFPRVLLLERKMSSLFGTSYGICSKWKKIQRNCTRCYNPLETDKHVFFECLEAKKVWDELSYMAVPNWSRFDCFKDWSAAVFETKSKQEAKRVVMVLWLLWKANNEELFEGKSRGAKQICEYGSNLLQEFQSLHARRMASVGYQNSPNFDSKWKPPDEGLMKINVDVSFLEGGTGVGIVVRYHSGDIQAVLIQNVSFCCSVEHAEALAILKALQFAKEYDLSHFVLESDALRVVNKINSSHKDLSPIRNIIEDIRNWLNFFPVGFVQYTCRKNNMAAHEAPRLGLSVHRICLWFVNFPIAVLDAPIADLY